MRIIKRIFVPVLVVIMIGCISYSAVLAENVYQKYNSTLEWENSSLQSKIHMVPPGLARNYVTGEEERLLEIVVDINEALEEIKKNKGISEERYDSYISLQERIEKEIAKNEDVKAFLDDNGLIDFNFYVQADSIIKNAYDSFNIEDLEKLESTLASKVVKKEQEIDKLFLEKIQSIAKDFKNLEVFSKKALKNLGAVKNGVLRVDLKVNAEDTEKLIAEIEEKDLKKFSHISSLYSILTSERWAKILQHNKESEAYFAWKESKQILESLAKSSYIPVSSLNTVADIKKYYPKTKLQEKANHSINLESLIENVYLDGRVLEDNLYVHKDAILQFDIQYEYIEDPKSKITVNYVDNFGNQLNTKHYENYVGTPVSIVTELTGYVLKESVNMVNEFGVEDITVTLIYEKYVPPVIEQPPGIEPPVEEEPEKTPEEKEGVGENDSLVS